MDIEHCDCLSWFRGSGESHEQDGERLMRATTFCKVPRLLSAPSDPAMALAFLYTRRADDRPVAEIGSGLAAGWIGGCPASAWWSARMTPRAMSVSGECPAARTTTCHGPHR